MNLRANKSQIEKRIAIEFIINEEFLLGCLVDSNEYGEVLNRLLTHGSQKAVVRRICNKEMLRDIIFGDFTSRIKRVAIRKINDESIIQKAFWMSTFNSRKAIIFYTKDLKFLIQTREKLLSLVDVDGSIMNRQNDSPFHTDILLEMIVSKLSTW